MIKIIIEGQKLQFCPHPGTEHLFTIDIEKGRGLIEANAELAKRLKVATFEWSRLSAIERIEQMVKATTPMVSLQKILMTIHQFRCELLSNGEYSFPESNSAQTDSELENHSSHTFNMR